MGVFYFSMALHLVQGLFAEHCYPVDRISSYSSSWVSELKQWLVDWLLSDSVIFRVPSNQHTMLESSCNVMAQGDMREGKWRGNWRMEWVASTLHTISERRVSSITTGDAHTSVASSRLNWRPHQFKWTRPFHRKTKSGFCACAITFQTQSATSSNIFWDLLLLYLLYTEWSVAQLLQCKPTNAHNSLELQ